MTISEADVIQAVSDRTTYTIQTKEQYEDEENLNADILYASGGPYQSNFSDSYLEAQDTLTSDLAKQGKTMTDAQKVRAYAYLIGDIQAKKDPTWHAASVSESSLSTSQSVSRSPEASSWMVAYRQLLASIRITASAPTASTLMSPNDNTYYPSTWRLSALPESMIDPFDPT